MPKWVLCTQHKQINRFSEMLSVINLSPYLLRWVSIAMTWVNRIADSFYCYINILSVRSYKINNYNKCVQSSFGGVEQMSVCFYFCTNTNGWADVDSVRIERTSAYDRIYPFFIKFALKWTSQLKTFHLLLNLNWDFTGFQFAIHLRSIWWAVI